MTDTTTHGGPGAERLPRAERPPGIDTRRVLALAVLALPTLLLAIDIAVIGVALPPIARALNPSASQLLWITDSYNYLVAATMLTMGVVADRYGRRRTILVSAAVFALASTVGAFAPGPAWLITARAVMGIAGSAILPASLALIPGIFPGEKARVQAMGSFMTVFLVGMAIAPFLGGLLLARFWWGSVFLIGVPVMLLSLAALPALVPESRPDTAPPIDLLSTAQSVTATLALVYAVKTAANDGADLSVWVAVAVGTITAVLFLRRQRRLPHPLVDLATLRTGGTGSVLAVLFLTAMLMGGSSLFFNLYLQEVHGLTPLAAAGYMLPQMLAMITASNVGPWLGRRYDQRSLIASMLTITAAGFVVFALLPAGGIGAALASGGFTLATFGIGACFPLLMDRAMTGTSPDRAGATAALAQLSNELGIAVGVTILGTMGTLVYRAGLDRPGSREATSVVTGVEQATRNAGGPGLLQAVRDAFTHAYNAVGIAGVLVMAAVLVLVTRAAARPKAG